MEVVFNTYDPNNVGILDYHTASRGYQRESLGNIDINTQNLLNQRASQSLYNSQGKYTNIKNELAATYVRDLIGKQAKDNTESVSLDTTVKSLFRTFFPDKEYLGVVPMPDGTLTFPVANVCW